MVETINDSIKIKESEIKEIRTDYETSVESKNLYKTPVLAGILALGYLGFKTLVTYKMGVDVGDLSGYQQQIMSAIDNQFSFFSKTLLQADEFYQDHLLIHLHSSLPQIL